MRRTRRLNTGTFKLPITKICLTVINMKITIPILITSLFLFSACDCLQMIGGKVIDTRTKRPIQGAYVQKQNQEHRQAYTDEEGTFLIKAISGGLFGCPPMKVVISKEGYKSRNMKIRSRRAKKIRLKPVDD